MNSAAALAERCTAKRESFASSMAYETMLFTRLPDRFRRSRHTPWSDANRAGMELHSIRARFPHLDGEWEQVAGYDGWPNWHKIHRDGRLSAKPKWLHHGQTGLR
jgi:hypothetical protein